MILCIVLGFTCPSCRIWRMIRRDNPVCLCISRSEKSPSTRRVSGSAVTRPFEYTLTFLFYDLLFTASAQTLLEIAIDRKHLGEWVGRRPMGTQNPYFLETSQGSLSSSILRSCAVLSLVMLLARSMSLMGYFHLCAQSWRFTTVVSALRAALGWLEFRLGSGRTPRPG